MTEGRIKLQKQGTPNAFSWRCLLLSEEAKETANNVLDEVSDKNGHKDNIAPYSGIIPASLVKFGVCFWY